MEPTRTDMSFWKVAYEDHGTAILGFLAGRLKRRSEAEDLLQETFVRAIRAGDALRDPGRVRSYLFSIAHRLILNQGRRKPALLFSDLGEDENQVLAGLESGSFRTPEEDAEAGSLKELVQSVLRKGPEDQRRAFEAAVFDQRPYQEIADREGWPVNRVRINVFRARQRLIAALGDSLKETVP